MGINTFPPVSSGGIGNFTDVGTTEARPGSPSTGATRYNTTEDAWEVYNGTFWRSLSTTTRVGAGLGAPAEVNFLVVAGGGSGGWNTGGGGGGAGGYLTSIGVNGGGGPELSPLSTTAGTPYTITIGAGGAGVTSQINGRQGNNSVFSTLTAIGGGFGVTYQSGSYTAGTGGSGGGAAGNGVSGIFGGGAGTANQGYAGGGNGNLPYHGGAGGGAGAVGGNQGEVGGAGLNNSISGASVGYAGGGSTQSPANAFGGGAGADDAGSKFGVANTGGGGGNGSNSGTAINSGGSGIVIISYSDNYGLPAAISAGLTYTATILQAKHVLTFTAGTGTVTW